MAVNPFYWKDPIQDSGDIVGRDGLARQMALKLKGGVNVALFGARKTGKTTFAFRLIPELAERQEEDAPPFVAVYIDLQRATSLRAFISCVAEAIKDPRLPRVGRDAVRRALEEVEREQGFSYRGLGYKRKLTRSEALQADENVLHATLAALRQLGDHVVVIFDEFQRLGSCSGEPLTIIRSALLTGGQGDVSLFVTGSIRQALEELLGDSNSPFFEQFDSVDLDRISRVDFAQFLELRFEATGKPATEEAIEYLLTLTQVHPLRTQQLAYKTWERVVDGQQVTAADVEQAFADLLAQYDSAFQDRESELLNGKPADQHAQQLLYLLADHGWEGSSADERLQAYGIEHRRLLQEARRYLIRKGLVEMTSGRAVAIVDPLYEAWLRQVSPLSLAAAPEPRALETRRLFELEAGEPASADEEGVG